MDNEETRSELFECDECDKKSEIKWREEIDDETLEYLEQVGWRYEEGVLFCDDCSCELKNN
jgi:hypothetical protein